VSAPDRQQLLKDASEVVNRPTAQLIALRELGRAAWFLAKASDAGEPTPHGIQSFVDRADVGLSS
jgi:hypothetical protein